MSTPLCGRLASLCRQVLRPGVWVLALGLGLGGCATAPNAVPVDTRYRAVSQDSRVLFIVVHYTVGHFASALKTLTQDGVSSHYLVDVDPPTVYGLVGEDRRAWHAGPSSWQGLTGLNASSVGIEIVNRGYIDHALGSYAPFPEAQVKQVVALVGDIAKRHQVKPHRIVGHNEIAPQWKQDPGPQFPWIRLFEAGLVPWPKPEWVAERRPRFEAQLPDALWFQTKLAAHGFALERSGQFDEPTRKVLSAFQMRYRNSNYQGQADAETAALLDVITSPGGQWLFDVARGERRTYVP